MSHPAHKASWTCRSPRSPRSCPPKLEMGHPARGSQTAPVGGWELERCAVSPRDKQGHMRLFATTAPRVEGSWSKWTARESPVEQGQQMSLFIAKGQSRFPHGWVDLGCQPSRFAHTGCDSDLDPAGRCAASSCWASNR